MINIEELASQAQGKLCCFCRRPMDVGELVVKATPTGWNGYNQYAHASCVVNQINDFADRKLAPLPKKEKGVSH